MNESDTNPENRIALFQKRELRRTIHNDEWWFVIADVVAALTDSVDPQGYLKDMCRRNPEFAKGWGKLPSPFPSRLPVAVTRSRLAPQPETDNQSGLLFIVAKSYFHPAHS